MSNNIEKAILEIAAEIDTLSNKVESLEYPDGNYSNYFGLLHRVKEILKESD